MTKQDVQKGFPFLVALFVIPGLAAALIPVRTLIDPTNVALVLVVAVVAVACFGDRLAAGIAALSAAVWFDFFHTRPYFSFTISRHEDLVTAVCCWPLAWSSVSSPCGLAGTRHTPPEAVATSPGFMALPSSSRGEPADYVVMAVATELRSLLALQDCQFDRVMGPDEKPLPVIEPTGAVRYGQVRWATEHIGLPGSRVALPVNSGGHAYGRYLLQPTPGRPLDFDLRVVAVALADQVGAALASEAKGRQSVAS